MVCGDNCSNDVLKPTSLKFVQLGSQKYGTNSNDKFNISRNVDYRSQNTTFYSVGYEVSALLLTICRFNDSERSV